MADIKLVTFDLDNTLWNVETVLRNAEARMRAWLDERIPGFQTRFPMEVMAQLRNAVLEENPSLRHDLSALREEILFRAIARAEFSRRDARTLAREAFHIFLDARHEVEFYEGAIETLERLSRDYVLGALTNGNADIRRLSIDRFFAFGYSAASVGVGKPAPDMFHAALAHAAAHPGEAVHVGDHLHDDVAGAADVGMHTIWVNHDELELPADVVKPSQIVHQLVDVPERVRLLRDD